MDQIYFTKVACHTIQREGGWSLPKSVQIDLGFSKMGYTVVLGTFCEFQ